MFINSLPGGQEPLDKVKIQHQFAVLTRARYWSGEDIDSEVTVNGQTLYCDNQKPTAFVYCSKCCYAVEKNTKLYVFIDI